MSKDGDKQQPDNDPRKGDGGDGGGDANFNWRGFLLLAFAVGLVSLAFFNRSGGSGSAHPITYLEFEEIVNEDRIHIDDEKGRRLAIVEKEAAGEE